MIDWFENLFGFKETNSQNEKIVLGEAKRLIKLWL